MKPTSRNPNRRDLRKTNQLCRQVARAIEYALSADCNDDRLLGLAVADVLPAPNTGHLLIIVQTTDDEMNSTITELHNALNSRLGAIRTAVANSISRRRTPTLTFQVLPPRDIALG